MGITVQGPEGRVWFDATASPVSVGRAPDCAVTIDDPRVSREHLRLYVVDGAWQLEDNSSSGTWLNGQQIKALQIAGPTTVYLGAADGLALFISPDPDPAAQLPTVMADDRALRLRPPDGPEQVFPPGSLVTVGRDSMCTVTIDDPLISRQHLTFTSDARGWSVRDPGSTRGTFIDGKRLRGAARVAGSFGIDLGAVEGGARVGVVTAGVHRKPKSRGPLVLGCLAIIIALLAIGGVVVAITLASDDELPDPDGLVGSVPLIVAGDETCGVTGSGSVVGRDLVLTNLHVVRGAVDCGFDPQVVAGDSESRVDDPVYETELVAADPELDLAVLRVLGDFDQPRVTVGNSDGIETGDEIRILGYPGAAGVETVTVTDGIASGRTQDMFGNSFIKTDTAIAPGNSGGAAFNDDGELIGVPTQVSYIQCEEAGCAGASFGYVRPIAEALDLMTFALTADAIPFSETPAVAEEPTSEPPDEEVPPPDEPDSGAGPIRNARFDGLDSGGEPLGIDGDTLDSAEATSACIVYDFQGAATDVIDLVALVDGSEVSSDSTTAGAAAVTGQSWCVSSSSGTLPEGDYDLTATVNGQPETAVTVSGSVSS